MNKKPNCVVKGGVPYVKYDLYRNALYKLEKLGLVLKKVVKDTGVDVGDALDDYTECAYCGATNHTLNECVKFKALAVELD